MQSRSGIVGNLHRINYEKTDSPTPTTCLDKTHNSGLGVLKHPTMSANLRDLDERDTGGDYKQ